ncbi:MAG: SDR family NAD(P)-dependent oxidoreductase [Gemmataceae bacterium]|nr:SDR family NAD(P)-dependent oxidoreductase [Gemmataceae bacterium]
MVGDAEPELAQLLGAAVHPWDSPDVPAKLGGLIFCTSRDPHDDVALHALRWLRLAGPKLRTGGGVLRLVIRGDGRFSSGCAPAGAAIAGLVKTAGHEWPEVDCRVIDAGEPVASERLADEIHREGPVETALADEARGLFLVHEPQPATVPPLNLPARSLVVVTGGARGVTAACALAVAATYRPTLLLLGRSPLPEVEPDWLQSLVEPPAIRKALIARAASPQTPRQIETACQRVLADREIRANLRRIADAGAAVEYRAVDVRDAAAVAATLSECRARFGPVRGIIHGSGVLADKLLLDKTDEQFRSVYETKVKGLESLLAACAGDPLAFVALFSSSTGRFGRTGQGDYAAANEYLNARARRLAVKLPECRTVALNWGPWEGGMVTPALRQLFAAEGVGLIPTDAGAKLLVAELSASNGPAEVVVLGPPPAEPTRYPATVEKIPVLADHVINRRAVLPVALAVEFLADAAVRRYPGRRFAGVEELRVLKAVTAPAELIVHVDPPVRTGERMACAARIEVEGRTCYRANVVLEAAPGWHRRALPFDLPSTDSCYRTDLFHGPAWRAVDRVVSCDGSGIIVSARTAPPAADWLPGGELRSWHGDPLALDSVLQAVIIYTQRELGLPSLPTGFAGLTVAAVMEPGPVSIEIRVTHSTASSVRADAVARDAAGRIILSVTALEHICSGGLSSAFARNSLAGAEA